MIRALECGAALLVVWGVVLIAWFIDISGVGHIVGFAIGVILLTAGVRLAIDVARLRDDT